MNVKYGLYDFSKNDFDQVNNFGEIYNYINNKCDSKFDTIMMLNTIHNAFPNYKALQNNINKFSNKTSNIIIRYLDRDLFNIAFSENNIDLNSYGFIKRLSNNKININFNWCHDRGNIEYIVSKNDLLDLFSKFEIIYEEEKIIKNNIPNIEKYFNCFKTIIFN
tara:strand:- start:16 stop:507 length:492 start_codon:yes stop_codon:yes gene_type:complete